MIATFSNTIIQSGAIMVNISGEKLFTFQRNADSAEFMNHLVTLQ